MYSNYIMTGKEKLSREEQMEIILANLCGDMRSYWGDYKSVIERVNAIKELCKELGRLDLIKQIDEVYLAEGKEYDNYDGRWFRDIWKGPYTHPATYNDFKERYNIDDDLLEKYPRSLFEFP